MLTRCSYNCCPKKPYVIFSLIGCDILLHFYQFSLKALIDFVIAEKPSVIKSNLLRGAGKFEKNIK